MRERKVKKVKGQKISDPTAKIKSAHFKFQSQPLQANCMAQFP